MISAQRAVPYPAVPFDVRTSESRSTSRVCIRNALQAVKFGSSALGIVLSKTQLKEYVVVLLFS